MNNISIPMQLTEPLSLSPLPFALSTLPMFLASRGAVLAHMHSTYGRGVPLR